jgi:hypothetical protein
MRLPVLSALRGFVVGPFRSRASLCLTHPALQHPRAVDQQATHRPHLRWPDRLFWVWLSRRWSGLASYSGVRPATHGDRVAAAISRPLAAPEPTRHI